ncbi:MAG: SLBB domain-containing protein [Rhodothermales bacterium]
MSARQSELATSVLSGQAALEGAVDEDRYVVGPGDVFSVSLGGAIPTTVQLKVSAEGDLVVPAVGSVHLASLSLRAAKETTLNMIKRSYVNESVEVSLSEPRQFYVHVTGAVPLPGRFIASPVMRVDDVIQSAYTRRTYDLNIALSGAAPDQREALERSLPFSSAERPTLADGYRPSLRTIRVERAEGEIVPVDLITYYATGDVSLNPFVKDGDVIHVGAYRVDRETVRVSGAAPFPGFYPIRTGDSVSDILRIAFGTTTAPIPGDVRVISRSSGGSEARLLTSADIRNGDAAKVRVREGDHLMILGDNLNNAAVYGWVEYPGTYPIEPGVTTINSLVADAGGLKDEADPRLAYVERRAPTFYKSTPETSDLDFFGRVNYRQALSTQRVLINVADALKQGSEVTLEDGDVIVFPKRESTVFVVGNVVRSGYIEYREGWTAQDYIEAVGGLAVRSRDVYVVAAVTGVSYKGIGQPVRPGDTVFVDREPTTDNPELQTLLVTEQTSRRQIRLASIQTVITGISTIAAVITTVVAIRR